MKPSDFKVGDRVRIESQRCVPAVSHDARPFDGKEGIVNSVGGISFVGVSFQYISLPKSYSFYPDELVVISPQSPQTQTHQQKEDTVKPYAVIYQNFTQQQQQGNFTGFYATEIEAKEAAELLAAAQRANLQVKQYFSITVINTKTGKLVGSVVDAPPAVDWATS